MRNCFKMKKYWFFTLGMLLLSNYSFGQNTFFSLEGGPNFQNGTPIKLLLLPTSDNASGCNGKIIELNIGTLTYIVGNNSEIPAGVKIVPVTTNGITILTISGFADDGTIGFALSIKIAVQFKPGTCDGVTQKITATTKNVGCSDVSDQVGSVTVTSLSDLNVKIQVNNSTLSLVSPYCPRNVIKYTVIVYNGDTGFNVSNAKLNIELDKCVTVLDVYKANTYQTINPVVSSGIDKVTINFGVPDLPLSLNSPWQSYDIFFMYPCINGTSGDCTPGNKSISAYLTGTKKDCGLDFSTVDKKISQFHQLSITDKKCGDVSCLTGGNVGETGGIDRVNYGYSFRCPNTCFQSNLTAYFGFSTPPLLPNYPNRIVLIDVPQGVNILSSYNFSSTPPCGTPYQVKYIDAQGNKQLMPFSGSLTRKIELTTDCTISTPVTYFAINFKYNEQNPPLPGTNLSFHYTYSSGQTLLYQETFGAIIDKCAPQIGLTKQVRKASQLYYENNYNASAVPGELMTYRQEIYNYGTGDVNNLVIDKIDDNLIYEGGFKYAYETYVSNANQFSPLIVLGEKTFTLPEIGNITISVPSVGQPGTVTLSAFNFPCTNKILYIEYNVRVKNNVAEGTRIQNVTKISGPELFYRQSAVNYITIAPFRYVTSKMFVKCSKADEWKESGINVKNGEVVDFKMQFLNAGSTPIVLSELINLRPQAGDMFEVGSNFRNSTLNINYNCDTPTAFLNGSILPSVNFKYALNSPTMDRDGLCPTRSSGNVPIWTSICEGSNWLKVSFLNNFTLRPGDYVDVIYKGRIAGTVGTAFNTFAFTVNNCVLLSANSNKLAIVNDDIGVGCKSCTLENAYSIEMKTLFENLMKNILTRKINGQTDAQINGSNPAELTALRPYITNGVGNKIYNFTSTVNAQNKITSIKFSFSQNSENDVTFLEENGINYNPEVGAIDPAYLQIDTTLYSSSDQYFTTCRRLLDTNGTVIQECNGKTQVRHLEFCPARFCYPMNGEIKTGDQDSR